MQAFQGMCTPGILFVEQADGVSKAHIGLIVLVIIRSATGYIMAQCVVQIIRVMDFTPVSSSFCIQTLCMVISTVPQVLGLIVSRSLPLIGTCLPYIRKEVEVSLKKLGLISFALLILVAAIVSIAHAVSTQAILVKDAAIGVEDTTAVGSVNDSVIARGTLVGLANIYLNNRVSDKKDAYQNAFNQLIQNALWQQESIKRGFAPTDQEVDARVQELLDDAANDEQQREVYIAQASALGTTWDSSKYRSFLKKLIQVALPVERLNAQIGAQVNGDPQKAATEEVRLLSELFQSASITLDTGALPAEAKNIHIPLFSEFSIFLDALVTSQPVP